MKESRLYSTFHVGKQYYGVPVADVQEVLQSQYTTTLPLAPPGILGLMNIRGEIVPAVAMRRVLRIGGEIDQDTAMNVVVHHEGDDISLVVDRVGDIVEVDPARVEAPPDTLRGVLRQFIKGVLPMPGSLLLLLDVHAVLADDLCNHPTASRTSIHPLH